MRTSFAQRLFAIVLSLHEKLDLHNLLGVNMCKKVQSRGKLKAKMVNTAFACQFTWGCKF